ncbi:MAG: DNA-3-methyladenine glycosylase I [Nitriliruptoraceae bacterium]
MTNAPEPLVPEGLRRHPDGLLRCRWCGDDPDYVTYHDREWGRPVHDERRLYEKLCLEGFQAGLSWLTILRKRPAFRAAFAGFDPEVVATFGDGEVERLLGDAGIVRSRAKIEATIGNARALLRLWEVDASLEALVWDFAPTAGPRPRPRSPDEVPAATPASTALAGELKSHGFRFVGPTTAYAFMQAMGLVDDHLEGCHLPPADRA